jgi:pyrroloquinoline-quinone synthase
MRLTGVLVIGQSIWMHMSAPPEELKVLECLDVWMARVPILSNRYFTSLRDDSMTREAFVNSQKQFYFAVRYFSRPMGALMARVPDSASRQGLIHNLSEEHGFDDESEPAAFDPALAHDRTFLAFLRTLGVTGETMAKERERAAVRAFNVSLIGTCMMERMETAFACLGVIEYAFADISELIGTKVVARGWVSEDDLVHYKLHAQIDKGHAADFFKMVEPAWNDGGPGAAAVEDGIALGLHVFNRLYEDLTDCHGS